MWWIREFVVAAFVVLSCQGLDYRRNSIGGLKRAVETYNYPTSNGQFDDKNGNVKTKVIVETIKSISPPEFLTSTAFIGGSLEASTPNGKIPVGSVTFNAFEPETTKTAISGVSTETTSLSSATKKKTGYRYSPSSTQKSTTASSSTLPPSPIRTTSAEPATTLLPANYQFTSKSTGASGAGEVTITDKPSKTIRGKFSGSRYLPKALKKPTKIEPKISDSKPEETGFNGYTYDVGSLGFDSKVSAPQGGSSGMMGASYMRSSSPFYNYHVMLD